MTEAALVLAAVALSLEREDDDAVCDEDFS
jgi:hypothetical protein